MKVNRIEPADRLRDDLGLAAGHLCNLDLIYFQQDLEEAFHMEITEADWRRMQTFQDAVVMILKKTSEN